LKNQTNTSNIQIKIIFSFFEVQDLGKKNPEWPAPPRTATTANRKKPFSTGGAFCWICEVSAALQRPCAVSWCWAFRNIRVVSVRAWCRQSAVFSL